MSTPLQPAAGPTPAHGAPHVLLTGGGTGGHIFPALAVATELRRRGCPVSFAGSGRGLEARLVPERGLPFYPLPARPLLGRGLAQKARSLATLAWSSLSGARLVRRLGARVVAGTGGYASAPAVLGGRLLGRPALLIEPNAHPGLANRQLSRWAAEAAVAYDAAAQELACPSVVTGVPVRSAFFEVPDLPTALPPEAPPRLLILGGSQGARSLNRAVPSAMAALAERWPDLRVVHQTGADHLEEAAAGYRAAGLEEDRVRLVPFIEEVAEALAEAHLVISRAGALTLAELAAAGRPAVLVPLGIAEGHQGSNARALEEAGAARVVVEPPGAGTGTDPDAPNPLADALTRTLTELLDADDALRAMGRAARSLGRPHAASTIADRILALAAGDR